MRFSRLRDLRPAIVAVALVFLTVPAVSQPNAMALSPPSVPAGFHVSVLASGLSVPTALTIGPDSRVYAAEQCCKVLVLAKTGPQTIASGFGTILGLAWHSNRLYVSSTGEIAMLTPSDGYTHWTMKVIISGLPNGNHQNDGIAFIGSWMYVGIGSTCNACSESDPRSATIMRFHPDGTHPQIYATGVRNPFGLAVRPANRKLYATDNGRDDFGDAVPDELNLIVQHGRYGWPDCWGRHQGSKCGGTVAPVALFPPHSSADGLAFYPGKGFGKAYTGDAFVAEFGDEVDGLGTGHVVQFVHFGSKGTKVGTFAGGFVNPLAVAVTPNRSLLVADFGTGVVWRIFR